MLSEGLGLAATHKCCRIELGRHHVGMLLSCCVDVREGMSCCVDVLREGLVTVAAAEQAAWIQAPELPSGVCFSCF